METNERLDIARRIVEHTGSSLFLTGKAGTGKTTFLRNLRNSTRKRIVVAAPTGIAAINAGGVTLHSFFQSVPLRVKALEVTQRSRATSSSTSQAAFWPTNRLERVVP